MLFHAFLDLSLSTVSWVNGKVLQHCSFASSMGRETIL